MYITIRIIMLYHIPFLFFFSPRAQCSRIPPRNDSKKKPAEYAYSCFILQPHKLSRYIKVRNETIPRIDTTKKKVKNEASTHATSAVQTPRTVQ